MVSVVSALTGDVVCTVPIGISSEDATQRVAAALGCHAADVTVLPSETGVSDAPLTFVRRAAYASAWQQFLDAFPGATEPEFKTYLAHESETSCESERDIILNEHFGLNIRGACFVLEVMHSDDWWLLDEGAREAGFVAVDQWDTRNSFVYIPGEWERFQEVMRAGARENEVPLSRLLLCSPMECVDFKADEHARYQQELALLEDTDDWMMSR